MGDGKDMTAEVAKTGNLNDWPKPKTLTFADTASTLAVIANDAEKGCANGGFAIKCTSTNPNSKWNMNSDKQRSKFLVSSASGGYKTPPKDSSGKQWYQKGYKPAGFGVPLPGKTTYADGVIKVNDICGKKDQESYWHFLFRAA